MASNFDFLSNRYPTLHEHATHAERLILSAPRASCFYSRFTLEQAVQWLYANDPYLRLPYANNLGALIHEQTFKENLKPGLFPKIRTVHKVGNLAVHDSGKVSQRDALRVVEELFHFLYWLCRYYAPDGRALGPLSFDRNLIPQPADDQVDLTLKQLQELESRLSLADEMRQIAEARQKQTEQELASTKAELDALKKANSVEDDTHDYNEADTRHYLIDVLLKEAGWDIRQDGWTEVEVQGMPESTNPSGIGYVDYVLWGDDGKPLALVEAKRTNRSATAGRHQAELYANCLEQRYGQRPVIFYSNGYETWIYDEANYPPRPIQGFLKKDELERLIFRRTHSKRLHLVQVNSAIVDRSYQIEAIRRITETFDQERGRKSLLVMATGTGKTRTAIALVDVLMRANWVKRVLFLADRNALLTQALRSFKRNLPTVNPIDLTRDKLADSANVVLSTYPTMLNAINRVDGAERSFGPGHFDLVLVDEAHRSIYKKYSALFDYFDALMVGLTATPRDEVDRDTYRIFELEQGNPSFAYELEDAIKDKHLVPPKGVDVPFKFMRKGIKYSELSPQEKLEYEEKFRDAETGEIPDQVNANAIGRWLFNKDTVDQALKLLMERGIKIDGGDRLGKTIIFARNHKHAEYIVERFDTNYPKLKGKFAQIIDSHDSHAQSLLDQFSEPGNEPTIAVSVDMLDTGVDVPEVVNLMFFKPVYSVVKFNQMIGRGTRLCKHLFGLEDHKTEFLVFDLCGNLAYFSQELEEKSQKQPDSISTKLVKTRLELAQTLANNTDTGDLRQQLLDTLHQHVATMEPDNFLVRPHLKQIEDFSNRDRWEQLSEEDTETIADNLAPLPNGIPRDNRFAKEFDLLCLQLQLAVLKQSADFVRLRDKVRDLMAKLEDKKTIPMVQAQLPLIEEIQPEDWWTNVTPNLIEHVRRNLRDLIKFVDRQSQTIVYTDFDDQMGVVQEAEVPVYQPGFSPYQYRRKVEAYIRENESHVAVAKLKRNLPLTEADLEALETMLFGADEIESRERFEDVYGKDLSLKLFIRKLVGCDRNAAKEAFSKYLVDDNTMSANQIRFIENIIDYLTQNGIMDPGLLYEPPFTEIHDEGLDGIFQDEDADQIISIVRSFNETVEVNFGVA